MLPTRTWGEPGPCRGPLLVLCHWLGGNAATWNALAERLGERGMRCVALDLPGFGDAADVAGYSVREMADAVQETVRALRAEQPQEPWLLVGHSMGGKVVSVVARDAENGAPGLADLRGVILMAASPAGPEPMKESKRKDLLDGIGTETGRAENDRRTAEKYVKDNTGKPALGSATRQAATDGVLRANKAALRAWLESGSKEDWRDFVQVLSVPALLFAGEKDDGLGTDAQRTLTSRQFHMSEVITVEGGGHLLPLERPGELAERIVEFCAHLQLPVSRQAPLSARFDALLTSDHTSPQTRAVMTSRLHDDALYEPGVLGRGGLKTLRELARRVVPGAPFDVAARVDWSLAQDKGDGWRYAALPEDCTAWRRGLATLDIVAHHEFGVSFASLHEELQDALLAKAASGSLGASLGERLLQAVGVETRADEVYTGAEMKLWFEEVRGELAKLYMADPRTMERVGFEGFADQQGFTQIRLGEREVWER